MDIRLETIGIAVDGATLDGTMLMPAREFPGVLFVHGWGGSQVHALARAREAAGRGACRREWPLMLRLDDGRLVEGTLDLAFEEPAGWTVVDFKTDEPGEASLDVYRRQVALYCRALRAGSDRPVSGVILQV